ncbi:MAG TPA: EF-hand domain-containing protein [Dyella sp.]|nr:EF-hand domain-containing protein [Dyella sp.]
MNVQISWIQIVATASLLAAGQALAAQTEPMSPPAPASTATSADKVVLHTSQGQVTIRSTLPPARTHMAPPPFAQLAGNGKFITPEQAAAYPLLANDFDFADSNRDGRISANEYARWVKGK